IVGAPSREIQINVDLYKMESIGITLANIEGAVSGENVIISGGELEIENQKMAVRLNGEFTTVEQIQNLVIRSDKGNTTYLKDIAEVKDGFKDRESYASLDGEPVITLNVIKKAGENLVSAADQIKEKIVYLEEKRLPENAKITISVDLSVLTNNLLSELTNTIIIGFILVTIVLMFFMGVRDSLFVGLAVPLSSFIAFTTLPALGYTLNMIVLFSFILALGIVVDNAIVVIENTYRILNEEKLSIIAAAKKAAGEVIGPVFAGTLTTVCPFLPLLFWPGAVGEFMGFLPVVMIITLFASLFVAYVINPVFAVTFMRPNADKQPTSNKRIFLYTGVAIVLGLLFHLGSSTVMGNLMFFMAGFILLNHFVLRHAINGFQKKLIPAIKNGYKKVLKVSIAHPALVLVGTFVFIVGTIAYVSMAGIKFIQFPKTEPNVIYVFNELPNGTNIELTQSTTKELERRVYEVIGKDNPIVKSVITNVAIGAGDPNSFDQNTSRPHKGKITVEFVNIKERGGISTRDILEEIRSKTKGIAGAKVTVAQDSNEPPGSAPVEVQITSEDFEDMTDVSTDLFNYLDSINIAGIEKLKWDADGNRTELLVNIDRQKASELGIRSGQVGMALRTALFGKEISKFRDQEDDYPIMLRLDKDYRSSLDALMNMNIRYMDMADGRHKAVPISSIAKVGYSSSYGGINRTDLEKAVTISSNVLTEYNAAEVAAEVEYWVSVFEKENRGQRGVNISVGGMTKDMEEDGAFLGGAFLVSIVLIFMILVTQFNSFGNVLIILSQVLLSCIGVLLGHAILGMEFSVTLSGMGMVVLAGIVVNNGIILLDFIQILRKRGMPLKEAIIEGGATRFTPVLLTASSTILGLVPLAISFNMNFGTLLSDLDPQVFFGGDSSVFWEPFSYSIIFGLSFATFITLIFVPVAYYLVQRLNNWLADKLNLRIEEEEREVLPVDSVADLSYIENGNGTEHSNGNGKSTEKDEQEEDSAALV
ncbi:MAG: efflux RND transporter permease subunit, partial [Bacteroidota bacterium]